MLTIAAGIIMLGILVFVHELGHFAVAKMAGVKVLKFSLGFGPRLLSFRRGETEYLICAVPLGGYVQMLGEGNGENGEESVEDEDMERSFAHQSILKRAAIVIAGPAMNLVLPFIILPFAFLLGVNLPAYLEQAPCAGEIFTETDAAAIGMERGDCIISVDGKAVATWDAANLALFPGVGQEVELVALRDGSEVHFIFPDDHKGVEGLESLGIFPPQDATIGGVSPGNPAEKAGLQGGDRIVSIDGMSIASWYDLRDVIQQTDGKEVDVEIERADKTITVKIAAEKSDGRYIFGIGPTQETFFKKYPLVEAIKAGAERTTDLISLTLVFIKKLFSGHVPTDTIGGPISVVQIAGQAAQTDLSSIFTVLAFLSIQLGILNLLPIPILDGGHLMFNLYEAFFRKPISVRAREIMQMIGLGLLLMLMALAFYNDLSRIARQFFG